MIDTAPRRMLKLLQSAAFLFGMTAASEAAVISFAIDPFAGSTALTTPGRQVVGNELFVPTFNLTTDSISVDANVFGIAPAVNFFNGLAADLPLGGVNFVILQNLDGDGDPTNGLAINAGQSANLIAAAINDPGAGFFVYFNTGLNVNRLVYSTDLSSPTADLRILARFLDQSGQAAISALPQYTAANFAAVSEVTAVPEPGTAGLLLAGLGAMIAARRRRLA